MNQVDANETRNLPRNVVRCEYADGGVSYRVVKGGKLMPEIFSVEEALQVAKPYAAGRGKKSLCADDVETFWNSEAGAIAFANDEATAMVIGQMVGKEENEHPATKADVNASAVGAIRNALRKLEVESEEYSLRPKNDLSGVLIFKTSALPVS
jgi:hypothetical protein